MAKKRTKRQDIPNLVGGYVPTADEIGKRVQELDAIKNKASRYLLAKRPPKMVSVSLKKGSEDALAKLAAIAKKRKLKVHGRTPQDMLDDHELFSNIDALVQALERLFKRASLTQRQARNEYSAAAYAFWTVLSTLAETDTDLEDELAPLRKYFKNRRAAEEEDAVESP